LDEERDVLLDAHCHIDQFPNPASLAAACEEAGVTTVAVTNLPSHYRAGLPHVGRFRHVHLALGFHPLVAARHQPELQDFLWMVPEVAFVGEIGLDFSKEGLPTKAEQLAAFRSIVEACAGARKFITLHSRGAEDAVLSVLEEFAVPVAVFHWYSGPLPVLDRAIRQGFYFSVNPAMVRSKNGQGIIGRIPRDRILTETDGPYVKVGSQAAEPTDVRAVLEYLAKQWGTLVEEAERQVWENYERTVRVPQ
jgi:TatD DNase family protein